MGVAAAIVGTLLLGTLAGWLGHWALHQRWTGRFYAAHRTHHRLYPPSSFESKTYRGAKGDNTTLFLGPAVAVVALAWLLALALLGVHWTVCLAVAVLGVVVGFLHEYLHEAFHLEGHWLGRFPWFQSLRALHLGHHRKVMRNLGVLWFGWDRLFRTFWK